MTNLCSAVLWQAPSRPNGEITGYDVQIGTEIMRVPSKLSYITTTETQREANVITRVSNNSNNYTQVSIKKN